MNKLLSEENDVPGTLFEARKVAGSTRNTHTETTWNCVVLQDQFVEVLSIMNKISSPKLNSAP